MAQEQIKLTTAQALIKFLNNQFIEIDGRRERFVTGVFTIFGHGNVLGIGQALEENPGKLKVYRGCNEQGMAHIAMGYAKQNKRQKIIAVTSSVGPGAANMITAAATATANRIPMLLLPGDTFATRQPDPVLQQIEQPHSLAISTNDCFKPVSKYWDRINRPEQLMTALIQAMRVLTHPADTGAVTICLPQDVQAEAYDYPVSFFKERTYRLERTTATDAMLKDAIEKLKTKHKPLIICGGGVRYSLAHDALAHFSKSFNIPIVETQAGKSALVSNHPLNLGGIGTTGGLAGNLAAKEADIIIGIGTRLTDFTTASKSMYFDKEIILINIHDFDTFKLDALRVIGDAKTVIKQLGEQLTEIDYKVDLDYLNTLHAIQAQWAIELKRLANTAYTSNFTPEISDHFDHDLSEYRKALNTELTQTQVLSIINEQIESNAIIVGAAGSLPGDLQRLWQSKSQDTYHLEYGYSCMGYEIAAAVGAKISSPDSPVYAFVGDGSYMMLHSEIFTAIAEGLKITILLFDNAGFGCINNLQMGNGMQSFMTESRRRDPLTDQLNGELLNVNFAKNAESYGCISYEVNSIESLKSALQAAQEQTQCVLIDIKVLPKTMTHDYASWWHVGSAQITQNQKILASTEKIQTFLKNNTSAY